MIRISAAEKIEVDEVAEAFPEFAFPFVPRSNRVVVQIRMPRITTRSGLVLTADSAENLYRNEQLGKIIALGASVGKSPTTGEAWPNFESLEVGDFVRVPLHGGDNYWDTIGEGDSKRFILFKTFKDHEIIHNLGKDFTPADAKTIMAYF